MKRPAKRQAPKAKARPKRRSRPKSAEKGSERRAFWGAFFCCPTFSTWEHPRIFWHLGVEFPEDAINGKVGHTFFPTLRWNLKVEKQLTSDRMTILVKILLGKKQLDRIDRIGCSMADYSTNRPELGATIFWRCTMWFPWSCSLWTPTSIILCRRNKNQQPQPQSNIAMENGYSSQLC